MNDPKKPLEALTEAQKARLSQLEQEILHDRITTSFTIDDRNDTGRRMATFYSTTVTKKQVEVTTPGLSFTPDPGWTSEEAALVSCLIAKQVVAATYKDALHRRVLPKSTVREELPGILAAYDQDLARLLRSEETPADAEDGP